MQDPEPARGVQLPESGGRRSSSVFGREVVAAALRADPRAAASAAGVSDWRRGYLAPLAGLVEAGMPSTAAALQVARSGLAAVHERMVLCKGGVELPLSVFRPAGDAPYGTVTVHGDGQPETELTLPYRGERLRGDALRGQLDRWVEHGVIEPSCRAAVLQVLAHPEWLAVPGRRVVVLGAGAQMGPLQALLRWGADVVGVDLPRPQLWSRVLAVARPGAGHLTVAVRGDAAGGTGAGGIAGEDLGPETVGADLLRELPEVASWLGSLPGSLVLGNYVYADGVDNLRVSAAVDALTVWLLQARPDTALAFLATPNDVFAVPADVVEAAHAGFERRSALRAARGPLRLVSAGRLLRRQYDHAASLAGSPVGLHDSLVPQQGPNYALAKRLQRWRAAVAADAGITVSLNIAPPTRTRSVLKNRLLAAAYAGCRRFGIEVFEPATSNVLMAALLVHDLHAAPPPIPHPYVAEALGAAHGGLWRMPYDTRSVLGLAVLVGVAGARG